MFGQRRLRLYVDGAIGDGAGQTGLGALIRDDAGAIVRLASDIAGPMTCNEAEYAALLLGLRLASSLRPTHLEVCSDSQVVLSQMTGWATVRSERLKGWHQEAVRLVRRLGAVSFRHVSREENRLADALAVEALRGTRRQSAAAGSPPRRAR